MESISALIAAIEMDFCDWRHGQQWAELEIHKRAKIEPWLLDLHDATNKKELLAALWNSDIKEHELNDHISLRLGFLFLSFLNQAFPLELLLERAADLADRTNFNDPSCEAFYQLLTQYDGSPVHFKEVFFKVNDLFAPHHNRARQYVPWLNGLVL